jgi:hypothetical protein
MPAAGQVRTARSLPASDCLRPAVRTAPGRAPPAADQPARARGWLFFPIFDGAAGGRAGQLLGSRGVFLCACACVRGSSSCVPLQVAQFDSPISIEQGRFRVVVFKSGLVLRTSKPWVSGIILPGKEARPLASQ